MKPEYYDKEEKGAYLAYLSIEILRIYKFFGNAFFNISRLFIAPIIGIVMIGKNVNLLLAVSVIPILSVAVIWLFKLYKQLDQEVENARKINVKYSNTIEQNTCYLLLYRIYAWCIFDTKKYGNSGRIDSLHCLYYTCFRRNE